MKWKLLTILLLSLAAVGCIKSIAGEEDLYDEQYHRQGVGYSAHDFLAGETFTSLKVEIQYMPGYEPDRAAIANLRTFLYQHLHKPGGITVQTKEIGATPDSILTLPQVMEIEEANRTALTSRSELTVYILYTNGFFTGEHMLGYAYRNTSAVIFGKNIRQNSGSIRKPSRTQLETRVLQHELGHLLGLVNVGTTLQSEHKDQEHGKHCTNKQCLMYYLTDTEESPSLLLRKKLPKLGQECLQDLKANGGK